MPDTTEPTNEALIARIAYLTERAEKAEAAIVQAIVEPPTDTERGKMLWDIRELQRRAEAAEAELAAMKLLHAHNESVHAIEKAELARKDAALFAIRGKAADLVHFYASTTAKEIAQLASAALAKPEPATQETK